MSAHVHSVNEAPLGGVPKAPVPSAQVTLTGLAGDRQRDLRHHGGPERAVCLFALERIEALQREGHPIQPGSTGENLTLAGVDWELLVPGARLQVGPEVVLEIASFTSPCKTIAASFEGGAFTRISQKLNPGWSRVYARVRRQGVVRQGDEVTLLGAG